MSDELVKKLLEQISALDKKVDALVAEKTFNSEVPLLLRKAAEVCNVEYIWLRDRVARKEIKAYRSGPAGSWRVFPKDVRALVMAETNQQPARRKSVLRQVA